MNLDIVASSGAVRAYLKSVGLSHLSKASSIEDALALLAKCSDSAENIVATAITTAFGDQVTVTVEVGDAIIANTVSAEGKKSKIDVSDYTDGAYIADVFVRIITDLKANFGY